MLVKVWHALSEVCFVEVSCYNEGCSRVIALKQFNFLQFVQSHTCVGLGWDVDNRGNYQGELTGQVKRATLNA